MSTRYPSGIDDNTTLPQVIDLVTPVKAEVPNNNRGAILAIESELGVDPSREYGTVRARLDAMQAAINKLSVAVGDATNVGTGAGVFRNKTSWYLNFRSLTGINGITAAVNGDEVDINGLNLLPRDGSRAMTSSLDMGTSTIINVVDPSDPQDAATKNYVDGYIDKHNEWSEVLAVGNTSGGTNPEISNGDQIQAEDGFDLVLVATTGGSITLGAGDTASGAAGDITLTAGTSTDTLGGDITITGGDGFDSEGGDISITSGGSTNNSAGDITIAGADALAGEGGEVTISAGSSGAFVAGADVTINGGAVTTVGGTGGGVYINGGSVTGAASTGGNVTILGGSGPLHNGGDVSISSGGGGVSSTPGDTTVTAGITSDQLTGNVLIGTPGVGPFSTSTSGNTNIYTGDAITAGDINIQPGAPVFGGGFPGTAGTLNLTGGDSSSGGDTPGGDINILGGDAGTGSWGGSVTIGSGAGDGYDGYIVFQRGSVEVARFDGNGFLDVSANRIVDVQDPVDAQDAATKNYVDGYFSSNNEWSEVLANGNTTGGTNPTISIGDVITSEDELNITSASKKAINIYPGATGSGDGGSLYLIGGDGDPGGLVKIQAGDSVASHGSAVMVFGSDAGSGSNSYGGYIDITAGAGDGTGEGGDLYLYAGDSGITGDGGTVEIYAGAGGSGTDGTITCYVSSTTVLELDGSTINAETQRITDVVDPVDAQDAATKNYVDGYFGGTGWSDVLAIDNTSGGTNPVISFGDILQVTKTGGGEVNVVSIDGSDDLYFGDNVATSMYFDVGVSQGYHFDIVTSEMFAISQTELTIGAPALSFAAGVTPVIGQNNSLVGDGSDLTIRAQGGMTGGSNIGGDLTLSGGWGSSTNGSGGDVNLLGGRYRGSGTPGGINFKLYYSTGSTDYDTMAFLDLNTSPTPDRIQLSIGNATQGYDGEILAPDGSSAAGHDLFISAGGGDTDQDGGDLTLSSGLGDGTGADGYVIINQGSTEVARWDSDGNLDLSANRGVDFADPIDPQDAATKNYVDNGGYSAPVTGTVTSTDASGDIITLYTPGTNDTVIFVEGIIIARDQTDGNSDGWKASAVFERTSGVVSQVGSTSIQAEDREDGTWTIDMSTDGTDITLDVVGDSANSVVWRFVGVVVEGP